MWPLIVCVLQCSCFVVCGCFFFIRDVSPKNGSEVFFSHKIYEKYSLAPTLSELWHSSNRYILLCYNFVLFVIILLIHNLTVWGESCMLSGMQGFVTDSLVQLCLLWNLRKQEETRLGPLVFCVFLEGRVVFWGFWDGVWVIFLGGGACCFLLSLMYTKEGWSLTHTVN